MPIPYLNIITTADPAYSEILFFDTDDAPALPKKITIQDSWCKQVILARDEMYVEVYLSATERYQLTYFADPSSNPALVRVKEVDSVTIASNSQLYAALQTILESDTPLQQTDVLTATSNGQTAFTLTKTAKAGYESRSNLYINGIYATYGADYTISGTTLTYTGAGLSYTIQSGDKLTVIYAY
jgi:hypothetical protein